MGRAPCCDKANVKKGPWSPEEDAKLKSYIEQHGTGGNWIALPQKIGLKRCGKSCRLRWLNYLRPNIKHGGFSEEEDNIICSLYVNIGSRWSIIAAQLPGRTDNDIKNYWNTRLKKKLLGKQRKERAARRSRAEGLKQQQDGNIIMKGSNNNGSNTTSSAMVSADTNNTPYWPVIAPTLLYEQPRFNNKDDHDSIKKLLIKLGGRISEGDDEHRQVIFHEEGINFHFPKFDHQQFLVEQQSSIVLNNMPSSSNSLEAMNTSNGIVGVNQFVQNHQYSSLDGSSSGLHMLQRENSTFPFGIEEDDMMFSNSQQKLEGLEFIYGENIGNDNRIVESTAGLGDQMMSSLLFPPVAAASIGMQPPQMLQEDASSHKSIRTLQ